MLLPDKYIPIRDTLPFAAKEIYRRMRFECPPYVLWDKVKDLESVATYERFVYALDFLYAIGLVEIGDTGFIRRTQAC